MGSAQRAIDVSWATMPAAPVVGRIRPPLTVYLEYSVRTRRGEWSWELIRHRMGYGPRARACIRNVIERARSGEVRVLRISRVAP